MSPKAKLLSFIALAGAGTIEIPFLLRWRRSSNVPVSVDSSQSTTPSSSNAAIQDSTVSDSPDPAESQKQMVQGSDNQDQQLNEGNCTVTIDISGVMENVLWGFYQQNDHYVLLQCTGTNTDSTGKLSGSWTGLFPKTLLKNAWKFQNSNKININTETKTLGGNSYETVFNGTEFNENSLTGKWNDSPESTLDENAKAITIKVPKSDDKPIYWVLNNS